MNDTDYRFVTAADRGDLMQLNNKVTSVTWPEFMFHDPVSELFPEMFEKLPQYQFALLEPDADEVVVLGNSIPIRFEGEPSDLPDTGWDWALQTGINGHNAGHEPTVLCALQIAVAGKYLGQGLSSKALKLMKSIGRSNGFGALFAPVRPTRKPDYPIIPIEDYIRWQRDDGLPFDPWMRVHVRDGASIVKVCHHAMRITGTIAEWEDWARMKFPQSGRYTVPGALVPVEIDLEADLGTYVEPNVWMHHPLG